MSIRLEPWGKDDLPLLEKTVGDRAMMEHLGGAESPEKMAERQEPSKMNESFSSPSVRGNVPPRYDRRSAFPILPKATSP